MSAVGISCQKEQKIGVYKRVHILKEEMMLFGPGDWNEENCQQD